VSDNHRSLLYFSSVLQKRRTKETHKRDPHTHTHTQTQEDTNTYIKETFVSVRRCVSDNRSSLLYVSCVGLFMLVSVQVFFAGLFCRSLFVRLFLQVYFVGLFGGSPGYGVATISRLLKIIGLFCRISSLL